MLLSICLCAFTAFAAEPDANGDGYYDSDVAAVNQLIESIGSETIRNSIDRTTIPDIWQYAAPDGTTFIELVWNPKSDGLFHISGVTMYDADFRGTMDLSAFEHLKTLYCHSNPELDALILPENSPVKTIAVSGTALSSLDVSGCPALEMIDAGNTAITELDLSANTELKYLIISNTGLTSIDLSANSKLEAAYFYNCPLEAIDVSCLPELTTLDIDFSRIKQLDVSGNPKLETLSLTSTDIESIDLSANAELSCFAASGAKISHIDLTNNPLLKEAYLSSNSIEMKNLSLKADENCEVSLDMIYDADNDKSPITLGLSPKDGYMLDKIEGIPENADSYAIGDGSQFFRFEYPDRKAEITVSCIPYGGQGEEGGEGEAEIAPEYIPAAKSVDGGMDMITVDGKNLEGFDRLVFSYRINVPFEKDSVTLGGTMSHWAAWADNLWKHPLAVGDNTIVVKTTAEDGKTNWFYTLVISRAPEIVATPQPTAQPTPEPTPEPTPAPTAAPTPAPTAAPTPAPQQTQADNGSGIPVLPVGIIALVIIIVAAVLIKKKKAD